MPTPTDIPQPSVAGTNFGNKEQITSTEFGDPGVGANPTAPDLTSEGKLFDGQAMTNGQVLNSLSIKIIGKPSQSTMKTLWVASDKSGAFVIQVMLDESEVVGGNAVWRNMTPAGTPIAVASGVLTKVDIPSLFRQMRIVYTNGADAAVVDAWVFSVA